MGDDVKKTAPSRASVMLRLDPADLLALEREVMRRAGMGVIVNRSALVREALRYAIQGAYSSDPK